MTTVVVLSAFTCTGGLESNALSTAWETWSNTVSWDGSPHETNDPRACQHNTHTHTHTHTYTIPCHITPHHTPRLCSGEKATTGVDLHRALFDVAWPAAVVSPCDWESRTKYNTHRQEARVKALLVQAPRMAPPTSYRTRALAMMLSSFARSFSNRLASRAKVSPGREPPKESNLTSP